MRSEITTLGGGCFWCLEAVFDQLKGVTDVVSGYAGGAIKNPSYEAVCGGRTGHAEVIQVTFDADVVSLENVLRVFFTIHDPTTLNRQGNDVGTQYRSAIFTHSDEQRTTAQRVIDEVNAATMYRDPVVTQLEPFTEFFVAEDYHQEYFAKHPYQGYCQFVVAPKVAKFRKQYFEQLKA